MQSKVRKRSIFVILLRRMFRRSFSLYRNFVAVISIIFVLLTFIYIYQISRAEQMVIERRIENVAGKINHHFIEAVDYTENLLSYMGRQLGYRERYKDHQYILDLFGAFSKNDKLTQVLSWTLISWVDKNDRLVVDAKLGVLADAPKMVEGQNHIEKAKETQWRIQLDKPRYGNTSGKWIIPAAVGILDIEGSYIGSLIFGFDIEKLQEQFTTALFGNDVEFALLDNRGLPVFASSNDININTKLLEKVNFLYEEHQKFSDISLFQTKNSYIYKLDRYPYALYIDYKGNKAFADWGWLLKENAIGICLTLIALFAIARYFHERVIKPVALLAKSAREIASNSEEVFIPRVKGYELFTLSRSLLRMKHYKEKDKLSKKELELSHYKLAQKTKELHVANTALEKAKQRAEQYMQIAKESDKAREKFSRRVRFEMDAPITNILEELDKLIGTNRLTRDETLDKLRNICKNTLYLRSLSSDELYITSIKTVKVLEECITIHNKKMFEKNIELEKNIDDLPVINVDEIKFKQIFTGLLSEVIDFVGDETKITFRAKKQKIKGRSCLVVIIEDNGFGLSKEIRYDFEQKDKMAKLARRPDGTNLSPDTIEHLVRLHKGTLDFRHIMKKGSKITVIIPYLKVNNLGMLDIDTHMKLAGSNVVPLFKDK